MKTAVVTGSSYGLGKSIVDNLLKNKFKVYGISRSKPEIIDENFVWLKIDLQNNFSNQNILELIAETNIDLLVNNAGTVILENTLDLTSESFQKLFGLNFIAPIKITSMLKDKLSDGLVINISSTSDRFAESKYGLYCASKAALNIYFDAVAIENPSIKIINLLPSYMDTPLQHKLVEKDFDWRFAMTTEKVAESVMYICKNQKQIETSSRIMVVNDKTFDDTQDPEKLYYYNVDTAEFKKVK